MLFVVIAVTTARRYKYARSPCSLAVLAAGSLSVTGIPTVAPSSVILLFPSYPEELREWRWNNDHGPDTRSIPCCTIVGDIERVNHAIDEVEDIDLEERAALFDDCFELCHNLYDSEDGYQRQSAIRFAAALYPRLAIRTVGADITDEALPGEWALDDESPTTGAADVDVDLEDEDLLEKATSASNGEKFERLWNGNTAGYDSQSEADMALCCLLAFWTGGDRTQMDQLFRQSGLLREKCDEVHYADGSTYGEKTIERAITTTSEFYDPDAGDDTADRDTTSTESSADARDDSERSRAYLTEKNRLLSERVDELEATLEQKTERINTLEAEIERLTDELAARDQQDEQSQDEQAATTREGSSESETQSVWERLFGGRSE